MNEYPKNDTQYEEVKVKSISGDNEKGYTIERSDGWSFFVPKNSKVIPEVGMTARFYGRGIGYTVRGLFLDGHKVYYQTELQEREQFDRTVEEEKIKRQKELDKNRSNLDARYNSLPEVFRKRLDKFRNTNPNFRRDYETYELFCCEQAVIFANHFKTVEALKVWNSMDYEYQKNELPKLSKDHSGNTFSCSFLLACYYLTDPSRVIMEHGALVPIVGCKEYGCPHPYTVT